MKCGDGTGGERGDLDVCALVSGQTQDVFDAAEVSDHAESRFTVLAEGLDDAVVAVTVGVVGLERSHQLGIYNTSSTPVNANFIELGQVKHGHDSVYTVLDIRIR